MFDRENLLTVAEDFLAMQSRRYRLLVRRLKNASRRPELSRSKTWRPAAASEHRILVVPLGSGFAEKALSSTAR
jgi:hypothetical protein